MDSVSNAVQTIAAADKGISAITKLVESAQSTARQALQTAETTGGTPATPSSVTGGTFSAITGGGADQTLDITGAAGTQTITVTEGDDIDDVIGKINAVTGNTGVSAAEGTGADVGKIVLTSTTGNITTTTSAAAGFTAGTTTNYEAGTGTANPKRAELVAQYNDLLVQIDQLAKDSGFNGVNLLAGDDLQVIFNEDGSSKLDIAGNALSSAGLGLTAEASTAFDTNAGINATLDKLKAGIETLRTEASKFGSNLSVVQTRQDFTKNMINVLETGAANLTLADTNEEAANLLALQTRQALSTTSLSMASQADQNVLQLLR
jgi:flagellin-like hook-associated protein FlgL